MRLSVPSCNLPSASDARILRLWWNLTNQREESLANSEKQEKRRHSDIPNICRGPTRQGSSGCGHDEILGEKFDKGALGSHLQFRASRRRILNRPEPPRTHYLRTEKTHRQGNYGYSGLHPLPESVWKSRSWLFDPFG